MPQSSRFDSEPRNRLLTKMNYPIRIGDEIRIMLHGAGYLANAVGYVEHVDKTGISMWLEGTHEYGRDYAFPLPNGVSGWKKPFLFSKKRISEVFLYEDSTWIRT